MTCLSVNLRPAKQTVFVSRYMVGHDPAGWVTVDPHTGDITTVKLPDRESRHVVNGVYNILLYAVDDGKIQKLADYMDSHPNNREGFIQLFIFAR